MRLLMTGQDQSIWDHYRQGPSARQIGRELGISHRLVQNRLNKQGGMRPAPRCRANGHLRFEERDEIS